MGFYTLPLIEGYIYILQLIDPGLVGLTFIVLLLFADGLHLLPVM